jgi:hypothetical protein
MLFNDPMYIFDCTCPGPSWIVHGTLQVKLTSIGRHRPRMMPGEAISGGVLMAIHISVTVVANAAAAGI